ncbi:MULTISPECIES: DUF1127 domain-containing protein [unclassified Thalassospira]|jgi:uncharacterized protein YjiS (DUF1127 family)|uniref:DUF1127 domain-containing protein n=1 Tax=unclassified Thalassospira TaxID=2648997 RepID=UPI000A1E2E29|nr:hypothetical protein [Thalassospira sp. MCCC 1A01428]OSQ43883.1 hypothetical protein THS27_08625 [Thalassospira sp. MCCC 1A01428]
MVAITKNTAAFTAPRAGNNDILDRLLALPRQWAARFTLRNRLADMDAHLLRDIGWDVYDARIEAKKPFWQV